MGKNTRKTGTFYERKAGELLEREGYKIIEYNYRCPYGEIDIIAKEGGDLVFCEVKYRRTDRKGSPLEAVTRRKRQRISKCALFYLAGKEHQDFSCRFDVAAIGGEGGGEDMLLLRNAFDFLG